MPGTVLASVTADGVKTFSTLVKKLIEDNLDIIQYVSYLSNMESGEKWPLVTYAGSTYMIFSHVRVMTDSIFCNVVEYSDGSVTWKRGTNNSIADVSSAVISSGRKMQFIS